MLAFSHFSVGPRRLLMVTLAAGLACLAAPAIADSASSSASGHAIARVVQPISVSSIANLDFGMVASSGPGTVEFRAGASAATYGGSARPACAGARSCPNPHAARFEASGQASRNYRIAVPDEIRISGPSSGLVVAEFTVWTASQPGTGARGRLDLEGRDIFEVGGRLVIPAALPPGHYSVTVPVIVTYD